MHDQHRRRFYEYYAANACERGILRLSYMRIGDHAVAAQLAVEAKGGFWLLKVGYDEDYANCSPGNLLLVETLKYAAARGLKSFEFLGSSEPWTEVWTKQLRPCVTVAAYPRNCHGAVAFVTDALRFAWHRINRKFKR
jgi:CelD/BcsL family acetyltransferase involved in cellulose biosynthesis